MPDLARADWSISGLGGARYALATDPAHRAGLSDSSGWAHNEGMGTAPAKETSLRYWLVVLVLIALGFLTIFSFGMYFWFMAVALTVLSPFRSRPLIFFPGLALFLGFLFAYVLIAPWGCAQSFTANVTTGEETVSPVLCTSPIGVEYSGREPFEPSRTPALIAGLAAAVTAAAATWAAARSRIDRETVSADA